MTRYAVLPTAADDPLVTIGKNGRRYRRAFDHEEAVVLRKQGWSYKQIATRLGVSETAVARVLDPNERARLQRAVEKRARDRREPCKGGCGRLVWMHQPSMNRTGYCSRCWGTKQATSVRDGELRCSNCHEWKDDTEFPRMRKAIARRGRASECRPCQTLLRQERRMRRTVECSRCKGPKLHPNDTGSKRRKTTLCRACFGWAMQQEFEKTRNPHVAVKAVVEKYRL